MATTATTAEVLLDCYWLTLIAEFGDSALLHQPEESWLRLKDEEHRLQCVFFQVHLGLEPEQACSVLGISLDLFSGNLKGLLTC